MLRVSTSKLPYQDHQFDHARQYIKAHGDYEIVLRRGSWEFLRIYSHVQPYRNRRVPRHHEVNTQYHLHGSLDVVPEEALYFLDDGQEHLHPPHRPTARRSRFGSEICVGIPPVVTQYSSQESLPKL